MGRMRWHIYILSRLGSSIFTWSSQIRTFSELILKLYNLCHIKFSRPFLIDIFGGVFFDTSQARTFPESVSVANISRCRQQQPFKMVSTFAGTTQFLTRTSMIELYLNLPSGRIPGGTLSYHLDSHFLTCALRNEARILPNGELEREHAEVVRSLTPKNQPYSDNSRFETRDSLLPAKGRKEVLEKLGYD